MLQVALALNVVQLQPVEGQLLCKQKGGGKGLEGGVALFCGRRLSTSVGVCVFVCVCVCSG